MTRVWRRSTEKMFDFEEYFCKYYQNRHVLLRLPGMRYNLARLHLISTCFLAIICFLLQIEDANTSLRNHSSNNCLVVSGSFGRSLWQKLLLLFISDFTPSAMMTMCVINTQFIFSVSNSYESVISLASRKNAIVDFITGINFIK